MRIVLDAGPLISLSNTCLLWLIERLPFDFIVPPWVVNEVSLFPSRTKHYKYSALRIRELLEKGTVKEHQLDDRAKEIADRVQHIANSVYSIKHRPLKIIQRGEAEAIAVATETDHVMLVDERTIRLLLEDPKELRNVLQIRTGAHVSMNFDRAEELQDIVGDVLMIRSADLVAYAYEEGYLKKDREFLEAALYALKYAGCAISEQEIQDYIHG